MQDDKRIFRYVMLAVLVECRRENVIDVGFQRKINVQLYFGKIGIYLMNEKRDDEKIRDFVGFKQVGFFIMQSRGWQIVEKLTAKFRSACATSFSLGLKIVVARILSLNEK